MSRRLPPLNALRAFEAAARHASLTRAAEELHVTPAAVSHQVRALEQWLEQPLFRRDGRRLKLTDAGKACLPGLVEGFDRLAEAVAEVRRADGRRTLNVTATPSLVGKWLVPRLERFRAAWPDVDVRLSATVEVVDLAGSDVDLAIRFGSGRYPGMQVDLLFEEEVFPVCAPSLLNGPTPLREPADLAGHTLIHDDSIRNEETLPDWGMWLRAAGVRDVATDRGLRFSPAALAVQAAIDGQGVALGRRVLVADDLAAGRLVRPFELGIPARFAYFLVCTPRAAGLERVRVFREWLLEEAALSKADACRLPPVGGAATGPPRGDGEPGAAPRDGPGSGRRRRM